MATDPRDLYTKICRRYPVPDRIKFNELHAKFKAGDLKARDALVYSSMGLILGIARRYASHGVALDDLVQAGFVALLGSSALSTYEPDRGFRFTTYAFRPVESGCAREARNASPKRPYQVPERPLVLRQTLRRIETHLSHKLGRAVDKAEIRAEYERQHGEESRKKSAQFWDWVFAPELVLSMDAPPYADVGSSLHELLPNEEDATRNPESLAALGELQRRIQAAVERLSSKEQAVLTSRFGLGVAERSLRETSVEYGVTRERIRQIEGIALRRLSRILHLSGDEVAELLEGLSPSWPEQEEQPPEPSSVMDIDESDLQNAFATLCEHAIDRLGDGHIRVKAPERTLHARLHLVQNESQAFLHAMQSKGWLRMDVRRDEAEILRLDYVSLSL